VACVIFIMLVNLRGVRESGVVFAVPSYFFLLMMSLTVAFAMVRELMGLLGDVPDPPAFEARPSSSPSACS